MSFFRFARPLSLLSICLFLLPLTTQATTNAGLFKTGSALWYQTDKGSSLVLDNQDKTQYDDLKKQAVSISTNDLVQIPIGFPSSHLLTKDTDGDKIDDEYERAYGTNLKLRDSDKDGYDDRTEVQNGYSPLKKAITMSLNKTIYQKYQGKFVWDTKWKELWFVSPIIAKRYFISTNVRSHWNDLNTLATTKTILFASDPTSLQPTTVTLQSPAITNANSVTPRSQTTVSDQSWIWLPISTSDYSNYNYGTRVDPPSYEVTAPSQTPPTPTPELPKAPFLWELAPVQPTPPVPPVTPSVPTPLVATTTPITPSTSTTPPVLLPSPPASTTATPPKPPETPAVTSVFTDTCRPENCPSVDWRVRARALPIPNYQRSVNQTGNLVLTSDQFKVILPDDSPNAEEFGRISLYQIRLAYPNIRQLLGNDPSPMSTWITRQFVLNHWAAGSCCGTLEEGLPTTVNAGTRDQYLQLINGEGPVTGNLRNVAWDTVSGDHELSHRFVWSAQLSRFLDEGLANFVQDHGQPQSMTCRQGGYEQNGNFYAYGSTCTGDVGRIYSSGDCFWQRMESLYGSATIQRVVARFGRTAERDALRIRMVDGVPYGNFSSYSGALLSDFNQAFIPEIGERFWTDFSDFGFSPTMAEGKSYGSENATTCQAARRAS